MKNSTNGAESQIEIKAISKHVLNHNQIRIFFHAVKQAQEYKKVIVLWSALGRSIFIIQKYLLRSSKGEEFSFYMSTLF